MLCYNIHPNYVMAFNVNPSAHDRHSKWTLLPMIGSSQGANCQETAKTLGPHLGVSGYQRRVNSDPKVWGRGVGRLLAGGSLLGQHAHRAIHTGHQDPASVNRIVFSREMVLSSCCMVAFGVCY